jgi:uncharacterized membrane protein
MRRSPVLFALVIAYPVLVYVLLSQFGLAAAAAALISISTARLIGTRHRPVNAQDLAIGVGGLALGATALLLRLPAAVLLYPVVVNFGLLAIFASSVIHPPTVIERIAKLRHELNADGVRYTRNVTLAWCVFFLLNGSVALWTALYASIEMWTLYNGFISYLLMGGLFVGEIMVRRRFMRMSAS